MFGRRVGLAVFVAVLLALAIAGIRSTPQLRTVAAIGSAESFVCSSPQSVGGSAQIPVPVDGSVPDPRPTPGTVPDSFDPVEAVVCDIDIGDTVAADGTSATSNVTTAATSDRSLQR